MFEVVVHALLCMDFEQNGCAVKFEQVTIGELHNLNLVLTSILNLFFEATRSVV